MLWFYIFLSVLLISLASLVGVVTLTLGEKRLERILILLVSFSAGTLLGDAFIHLIPGSLDHGSSWVSIFILSGILSFFVLEKIIYWRHCHEVDCPEHSHILSYMILIGDGFHNFLDGMIIAASFLISVPVGVATTLAVFFHEVPQEIGDFGVLLHDGFSKGKALLYNFFSALTAFLGAGLVLLVSLAQDRVTLFLVPFAAGGFIYIAMADMIPELHKKKTQTFAQSFNQVAFFVLGIFVMWTMLFLE